MQAFPFQFCALDSDLRPQIQALAHAASEEICGVVCERKVIKLANLAVDRQTDFIPDPRAWGHLVPDLIWHTHINGKGWSGADIRACKQLGIPWYLFQLPEGKEYYYDPKTIAPYLGRVWQNWIADCYTLIRDWYLQELSIELPDFERELIQPDGSFSWLESGWDMYRQELQKFKFVNIGTSATLERGDIILMNIRSPNPNHAAVYFDPERNLMLHHLINRLSAEESYGFEQRQMTDSVWRLIDKRATLMTDIVSGTNRDRT